MDDFERLIVSVNKIEETSPHYSLICKRAKEASELMPKLSSRRPTDLVIDSSGLKIHGEGEWKVKMHGTQSRRGWIKLHIAVDPASQELISIEISDDKQTLPNLVNKVPKSVRKVIDEEALAIWKKLTGYHRRSLVETAFSRLKQVTGSKLSCRSFKNQTDFFNTAVLKVKLI